MLPSNDQPADYTRTFDAQTQDYGLVVSSPSVAVDLTRRGIAAAYIGALNDADAELTRAYLVDNQPAVFVLPPGPPEERDRWAWAGVLAIVKMLGLPYRIIRELGDEGRS